MNIDAFRCMRRGVQLNILHQQDAPLLAAINQENGKRQRALLLIHGFSSTPAVYRLFLPALSEIYDAIFCPVLIGHSDCIDAFAKTTATSWISQIEQTYQNLANQYAKVEVLGLSLGGLLACHLSQRFNLPHLYLLAPAIDLELSLNKSIKLAKALNWLGFRRIRAVAGNLYTSANCEIAYRQIPLTTIIEMLTLVQQFTFNPPVCPTDLFLGCYDQVVSSKRVADRFAGSNNVNIHWLDNSAHVLPLDGNIDYILECIRKNVIDESLPRHPELLNQ